MKNEKKNWVVRGNGAPPGKAIGAERKTGGKGAQ